MPKTTETSAPEPAVDTPLKAAVQNIEHIKETLKNVVREFNDLLDVLKQVEKEKKAGDREMETVRGKLREIQSVRI